MELGLGGFFIALALIGCAFVLDHGLTNIARALDREAGAMEEMNRRTKRVS